MIFNLFLIVFWFLTLVSPVDDYHKNIKSLTDTRITLHDKYAPVVLAPESVLLVFPSPPAPLPRYSPLVVPVYTRTETKEPKSTRFGRSKRIFAIRKWVDVLFSYFTDIVGRPRPTRTPHTPTNVFVPAYPAPPTTRRLVPEGTPASVPTSSTFDLTNLWNTYKLIIGWIAFTLFTVVLIFIRFLSRARFEDNDMVDIYHLCEDTIPYPHDPVTSLGTPVLISPSQSYSSLMDLYYSLELPPVAPEDIPLPDATANELLELADSAGSALTDVTSARTAWIDAKTGDAGNTSTSATSVGGSSLEPAISHGSISSFVGLSTWELSPVITPSSSQTGISRSESGSLAFADRFPPTDQVHTPRTKLWLERLIIRLRDMERRGNYYGRVYDGWNDNPDLETRAEESGDEEGSVDSGYRHDTPPEEATELGSALTNSDLSSVVREVFGAHGS